MAEKRFTYAMKFGGMFGSLTTFVCCANIFLRARGEIDLSTLLYAASIVIPGAVIVGYLGFRIGKIMDKTKKKKKTNKFK